MGVSTLTDIDSACACHRLRRGARAITGLYDAALAPAGLNVAQFSLLRHIERLAPIGVSALAGATGHERTTLARTLRPLQARALIRIHRGDDRRSRMIELTEHGQAALAAALPGWQHAQAEIEARLDGDHHLLFALLDRLEIRRP